MKITLRPEGATDSSTDVVLADGADRAADNVRGPAMGSNSVSVRDQPFNAIRAPRAQFINRENRSGSYQFKTSRRFASLPDAGRFMLTHGMTCPASGTLFFDFGDAEDSPTPGKLAVLFGVVIRQIGQFEQIGVTVIANYSCVYGDADEVLLANLTTQIATRKSLKLTKPAAPVSIKINCGGWADVDGWVADTGWTGVTTAAGTDTETESPTAPLAVCQTCRKGETFTYAIDVPDGTYAVQLHFAELLATEAETNIFDVLINGVAALTDYDIFAAAGDKDIAAAEGVENIVVADGDGITIEFTKSVGLAQINGIEIFTQPEPPPEEEE